MTENRATAIAALEVMLKTVKEAAEIDRVTLKTLNESDTYPDGEMMKTAPTGWVNLDFSIRFKKTAATPPQLTRES